MMDFFTGGCIIMNYALFISQNFKGEWLTVFFLGLIMFMGCSQTCVNASFK